MNEVASVVRQFERLAALCGLNGPYETATQIAAHLSAPTPDTDSGGRTASKMKIVEAQALPRTQCTLGSLCVAPASLLGLPEDHS